MWKTINCPLTSCSIITQKVGVQKKDSDVISQQKEMKFFFKKNWACY